MSIVVLIEVLSFSILCLDIYSLIGVVCLKREVIGKERTG